MITEAIAAQELDRVFVLFNADSGYQDIMIGLLRDHCDDQEHAKATVERLILNCRYRPNGADLNEAINYTRTTPDPHIPSPFHGLGFNCPRCQDTGFRMVASSKYPDCEVAKPCDCRAGANKDVSNVVVLDAEPTKAADVVEGMMQSIGQDAEFQKRLREVMERKLTSGKYSDQKAATAYFASHKQQGGPA